MQFPGLILVQAEVSPQINPPHLFIGRKPSRGPGLEDGASVHDVGTIGDAQCFAHVVIGDEHADAAIPQMKNDLLDVGDRDGIDAGKGLVQEQQLGTGDESTLSTMFRMESTSPPGVSRRRITARAPMSFA